MSYHIYYWPIISCSGEKDMKIKIWNLETFECIKVLDGHLSTIVYLEPDNLFKTFANKLNNIGILYERLNQHEKSLDFYSKAYEMRKIIYKDQPNHPDIATSSNNIANSY